jgi:hypothetical protein
LTPDALRTAAIDAFTRATGWELTSAEWTDGERRRIDELAATKYTADAWNRKR